MRITPLTPELAPRYEAFLRTRPEAMLYHSWSYQSLVLELLGARQRGLVALDESGVPRGALPLMAMDGPVGTVLNSLPYYGSHGGFVGDDPLARDLLLSEYRSLLQSPDVASATVVENPFAPEATDSIPHDLVDERIGQLTPLPREGNPDETLMSAFHSKTRNMIRKAEKLGVRVEVDPRAMEFLVEVHEANMREIGGRPKSRRFFELLPRHFREGKDFRIYRATLSGEPVAALLLLFHNGTVEYFTPVVRKESRESQALSATIWTAMRDAAREGYGWWNWGGTWLTQDGVYRFKSRWGTEDRRYRYFTRICRPAVLRSQASWLLEHYPGFFVVPFGALRPC